ncbi:hypothetical protein NQZ79_g7161 [Umbelopsis isabellina]|nr:hypothetical protein NQZ79_g7161 [Umbelopsis isabellina]
MVDQADRHTSLPAEVSRKSNSPGVRRSSARSASIHSRTVGTTPAQPAQPARPRSLFDSDGNISSINILNPSGSPAGSTRRHRPKESDTPVKKEPSSASLRATSAREAPSAASTSGRRDVAKSRPAPPESSSQRKKRRKQDPDLISEPESNDAKRRKPSISELKSAAKQKRPSLIKAEATEKHLSSPKKPKARRQPAPAKPLTPIEMKREEFIAEREKDLQTVVAQHDATVRELYFLEVYQNMLDYDPAKWKLNRDDRLMQYMQNFDLWSTVTEQLISKTAAGSKGISTRRTLTQRRDSLLNMLQDKVGVTSPQAASKGPVDSSRRITAFPGITAYRRPVREYPTLEGYLKSFVSVEENEDITPEQANEIIEREASLRDRIHNLKQKGGLNKTLQSVLRRQAEPAKGEAHHDVLINQVVSTAKLFHNNSKYRKNSAKKVAKAIERYWESLRTQDERMVKEEARRLQRLAKWTAQEVKKKWKVVERVCEARYKELLQEEQAQRGKRHLDMILEHSEQMLGVRMGEISSRQTTSIAPSSDNDTAHLNGVETNTEASVTEDEKNDMASQHSWESAEDAADHYIQDQSSSDDEELGGLEEDMDMPIEELLKKYNYGNRAAEDTASFDESSEQHTDVDQSVEANSADEAESQVMEEESQAVEQEDQIVEQETQDAVLLAHYGAQVPNDVPDVTEEKDVEYSAQASDEDIMIEQDGESEDDDVELNGLADDADVPIEELLKRYGYADREPSTDEDADDEEEEEEEEEEENDNDNDETPADPMDISDDELANANTAAAAEAAQDQIAIAGDSEISELKPIVHNEQEIQKIAEARDDVEIIGADEQIPDPDEDYVRHPTDKLVSVDRIGSTEEADDSDRTETEMGDEVTEVSDDDDYQAGVEPVAGDKMLEDHTPPKPSRPSSRHASRQASRQASPDAVKELETRPDDSKEDTSASAPPTGTTLSTATVNTKVPFLLRGTLREYQHVGLDWMASLYSNGLNGILADEMGLGKTIQTIALLAYLACEKGIWGPHLVVVPTSVMLNWEMEFKKWLPGFKILTYYGNPKERKEKRLGWSKENAFHVCITSYQLVCHDQTSFRRKAWQYLILDEAHHIKNFRSQRWQVLLNFNAERRLLLTGTPLQNNLMELWSLLYFLMPNGVSQSMPMGFANQKEFQEWFSHPVDRMIENEQQQMDEASRAAIQKLHTVLRPYLLRRLKADVEKQMPAKYEHVVYCRLSKRQRYLYDDFMGRGKTKETLASGNFLSIINCLMQLRKVCNHPDLFEVRPIVTSFAMSDEIQLIGSTTEFLVRHRLINEIDMLRERFNYELFNFDVTKNETSMSATAGLCMDDLCADNLFETQISSRRQQIAAFESRSINRRTYYDLKQHARSMRLGRALGKVGRLEQMKYVNHWRCTSRPQFGTALIDFCRTATANSLTRVHETSSPRLYLERTNTVEDAVVKYDRRMNDGSDIWKRYAFVTPSVLVRNDRQLIQHDTPMAVQQTFHQISQTDIFHGIRTCLSIAFPDKRLLQYDCGKLQKLDTLLRDLKAGGHRALIFTQMTRVLDVLEIFLNIHGHRYLRLDGATKVEQRQVLTERFNNDKRILAFILSTRSGGLGINLTGADTVIFYDSDWNPSMDKQCQDRTHRIGQTRDVHIYRFVTEYTIEENIFKKANQKRMLDNVVIQEGDFTTEYFEKMDWWKDLPEVAGSQQVSRNAEATTPHVDIEQALLEAEDDETDARAAIAARKEMRMDETEFADTPAQDKTALISSRSATTSPGPKESNIVIPSESLDTESQMDAGGMEAIDEDLTERGMQLEVGHVDQYMLRFWEREMFGQYLGFGGLPAPDTPGIT